ncbi:MAG TPA: sodium-independent anion transporter, partial [Thermoanaerobaculia bacterium]|nr:sodium-independent anion transporter [Thermoanaerobaculia bacterium]
AVAGLVRVRPILSLWSYSRPQFVVAAGTLLLTLMLSPRIDQAVVLGVLLAISVHLWREFSLRIARWQDGDTLNIRPEGVLWFGSAEALKAEVADLLADHRDAQRLVVHMERLGRVDLTGSLALEQILEDAQAAGLDTDVVNVHPQTARALRRVLAGQRLDRRRQSASPPLSDPETPAQEP